MLDWLTVAKTLPAGGRRKIPHCGSDKTMNVWNGDNGYSAYCHRCGTKGFEKHGQFSIGMIARRKAEREVKESDDYRLPSDYSLDVPADKAVWYYKAGIGPELARDLRFGYSPKLQRVIIPLGDAGEWIGRSVSGRPKYIQKAREGTLFCRHGPSGASMVNGDNPLGLDAVVCEDILSAIRVSRFVLGWSILGTSLSASDLRTLLDGTSEATGKPVQSIRIGVWLDPDGPGRKGSARALRTLAMQGVEIHYLVSPKDPKNLSNDEIRRYLAGHKPPATNASQEGLRGTDPLDFVGDS